MGVAEDSAAAVLPVTSENPGVSDSLYLREECFNGLKSFGHPLQSSHAH
jgi:hypothetical protein